MTTSFHIADVGMVTPVGLDAPSSLAAMRARLDGFRETRFRAGEEDWLIGAPVPLTRDWIGPARMTRLLAATLAELRRRRPDLAQDCGLILCLAEEDRPGRPVQDARAVAAEALDIAGMARATPVRIVAHGRPSGFVALGEVAKSLAAGARNVIVAGVDSYLTARSVAHYLGEGRLQLPGNANGFIPGEAAAAVLCTAAAGPLRLSGYGLAREAAYIYNQQADEPGEDRPLRGDGMTSAYRQALDAANVDLAHVDYRISDLIGEQYWFRQSALAHMRLERGRSAFQDLWSPGENMGNVGAAVVPIMLGMALQAVRKGYAPGSPVLIEASGDDGACGAAVLHEARAA
jgi:3-oxoacyl-[acyl-carrier-protein] synthase-1